MRYYRRNMSSLTPTYIKEERPWGTSELFAKDEGSAVKILRVFPNKRFSLQKHAHRAEHWQVIEGWGTAHVDGEDTTISVGSSIDVPLGSVHRLTGGDEGIAVLEIITGAYDENDIERLEDDFGRTN